ncbi:hypothetical protein [Methylobacterium phyllostachyos]|uniref:hypothetical protein n=1 Tax=Methylobacterium phyllostachyos TaxID=582672 RepID=UPI00143083EB|nr:hypothetical protein [Methylobacterium phyllostachyos]
MAGNIARQFFYTFSIALRSEQAKIFVELNAAFSAEKQRCVLRRSRLILCGPTR